MDFSYGKGHSKAGFLNSFVRIYPGFYGNNHYDVCLYDAVEHVAFMLVFFSSYLFSVLSNMFDVDKIIEVFNRILEINKYPCGLYGCFR